MARLVLQRSTACAERIIVRRVVSALLFREIPSAPVMSQSTSAAYRQAKDATQDVVFNTLYILSNTKVQSS